MTPEQRKDFILKVALTLIGLIISALVFNNPNQDSTKKVMDVTIIILILIAIYFWEELLSSSKSISFKIIGRDKISELEKEKANFRSTINQISQLSKDIKTKLGELLDKPHINNNLEVQDIAEFDEVIQKLEDLQQITQQYEADIELADKISKNEAELRAEARKLFKEEVENKN